MTRDEFNAKAAEVCGYPKDYGGPFDPLTRDPDAMLLWDAVLATGEVYRSELSWHWETGWDADICPHSEDRDLCVTKNAKTRAVAICRVVADFLGWGVIKP